MIRQHNKAQSDKPRVSAARVRLRLRKYLSGVLLGAAIVFSSQGVDAQTVNVVGIGAATCAQFLQEIETSPVERDYIAWAQGYMSGLLARAPAGVDENLDLLPSTFPLLKQAAFLRTYCVANTTAEFGDAVDALYRTLRAPPS